MGLDPQTETLASGIIESAFRVHRQLGPGLLESVYEICLKHGLQKTGIPHVAQMALPVIYDSVRLEAGLRLDLLVADKIVVEIKAAEKILPIHEAQVLTYLKLSGHRFGSADQFQHPAPKRRHSPFGPMNSSCRRAVVVNTGSDLVNSS